jgi:hypothetical protein
VTAVKGGSTQNFTVPMRAAGGGMFRGAIQPSPSPDGTVGMDVTFHVHATDPGANASDSTPATFRICGAESYGAALPNSTGQAADATGINDPSVGANDFQVQVTGLPPNQQGRLIFGTAKVLPGTPYGNGLLYVGGTLVLMKPVTADAQGVAVVDLDFTQPPLSGLSPGETRFFQYQYRDFPLPTFNLSDALEITICD